MQAAEQAVHAALESVGSLTEDEVLRALYNLIQSSLRTNFYPGPGAPGLLHQDRQPQCRRNAGAAAHVRNLCAFEQTWKAFTCAAGVWPAAASAGATGMTISGPRSWV